MDKVIRDEFFLTEKYFTTYRCSFHFSFFFIVSHLLHYTYITKVAWKRQPLSVISSIRGLDPRCTLGAAAGDGGEGAVRTKTCFRSRHPVHARRFYSPASPPGSSRRPSARRITKSSEEHCPGTRALFGSPFHLLRLLASEKSGPDLIRTKGRSSLSYSPDRGGRGGGGRGRRTERECPAQP